MRQRHIGDGSHPSPQNMQKMWKIIPDGRNMQKTYVKPPENMGFANTC